MKILNTADFKDAILLYLEKVYTGVPGHYRSCIGGHETLYASCFALMIYHYLDALSNYDSKRLREWGRYILDYQDKESGYFVGPEISKGRVMGGGHSIEHLKAHMTVHVLPTLKIIELKPVYPLRYAHRYVDTKYLSTWLAERDWRKAWLEGNNLLFVGQLLTYLYEEEHIVEAKAALEYMLRWLDRQVDAATGLWGTNGYCNIHSAMYGGYHQLLLYYYWGKAVSYMPALIDSVLFAQYKDGGFSTSWGGGTCEDVDGVDILVNMYKREFHRRNDMETALKRAFLNIWRKMTPEGGFVYKIGEEFIHNGMEYTYAPKNIANMFSTWFCLHAILLISEIIELPCTQQLNYKFNPSCSMGWHLRDASAKRAFWGRDFVKVWQTRILGNAYFVAKGIKDRSRLLSKAYGIAKRFG